MSRRPPLVVALLLSSHPVPGAAVTAVALTLAISVGLEPWRVAVVTLAFAANQLSIGWSHDWVDAARDRIRGRDAARARRSRGGPEKAGPPRRHRAGHGADGGVRRARALGAPGVPARPRR